jgi:hypothetical protein
MASYAPGRLTPRANGCEWLLVSPHSSLGYRPQRRNLSGMLARDHRGNRARIRSVHPLIVQVPEPGAGGAEPRDRARPFVRACGISAQLRATPPALGRHRAIRRGLSAVCGRVGPVSISARYAPASRRLIVECLSAYSADTRLARHVKPRRPFRSGARPPAPNAAISPPGSIDELSRRIAQRQYLQLGGRLLGFNLDRKFGDTLDGPIMMDLREVEKTVLARYMGKREAAAFRAYHARAAVCQQHAPWCHRKKPTGHHY